eukprot:TRINITY_DN2288_c0_g1_i3.p1 TRINITY_DN2288_c0_g1~~TRINITY_DN2288_c0_g1_i3.p1  ORF type:complete len:183 (-),score=45.76 TRINITY_DN2288_c0_g1_i3:525-1010(-)
MGKQISKEVETNLNLHLNKSGIYNESQQKKILSAANLEKRILEQYPFLERVNESAVVADIRAPDQPIIYVNDNFQKLTLYDRDEIIGRNCRFLQGKYTDRKVVAQIREAIETRKPLDVEILNYRKDGIPFWFVHFTSLHLTSPHFTSLYFTSLGLFVIDLT